MYQKPRNAIKAILLFTLLPSLCHAKSIYPAEILGRDLNYPGLGWLGHVGIATTDMMSAAGMNQPATQVIEILNETPVGQINTIENFKRRSRYWGSKYGIADRGERGYRVLVEANHQRWWCPSYTSDTDYRIGEGNPHTGAIKTCGRWRCDTFVWWAFYSQGYDLMPGRAWLPRLLFNAFPFFNDERGYALHTLKTPSSTASSLTDFFVHEINSMPLDAFVSSLAAQPTNYVVQPNMTVLKSLALDERLTDIKRGVIIDRLTSRGTEPSLVPDLINLYETTSRTEVKRKVVEGLMFYHQALKNNQTATKEVMIELKTFFYTLLERNEHSRETADAVIRGFIDTHTPDEIFANMDKIDRLLPRVGHHASIMLKYSLVHQSKQLEPIYIKSIVEELRKANDSDLDSYFFGPLNIGYKASGDALLEPASKERVIDYLKEVHEKYIATNIQKNISLQVKDIHYQITASLYHELLQSMGIITL